MAKSLHVKLGGDTYYFGELKKKPYFGDGRKEISSDDVEDALAFRNKVDLSLFLIFGIIYAISI